MSGSHLPTCRVVLDLQGIPWAKDPRTAATMLRSQPGVIDVEVDPETARAVVVHDAETSLPRLWNWLVRWRIEPDGPESDSEPEGHSPAR
ncbi:hypothetical protein GCM10022380_80710 [Amycolatopsis tucumanensis]|uniref:Cation transporter n=1 Tax=Amycolatopsis tucumanensis TaxID=401106 RepID=A0ABP7JQ59_9PSEU